MARFASRTPARVVDTAPTVRPRKAALPDVRPTAGPYHVAAQNGMTYLIAGRAPSMNDDYPVHDADRVVIARVYDSADQKDISVESGEENALLLAAAPALDLAWSLVDPEIRRAILDRLVTRGQEWAVLAIRATEGGRR